MGRLADRCSRCCGHGGFMRVGLYSKLGRRATSTPRARFVAERGYAPTAEGIRRSRQDILALPDEREPARDVVQLSRLLHRQRMPRHALPCAGASNDAVGDRRTSSARTISSSSASSSIPRIIRRSSARFPAAQCRRAISACGRTSRRKIPPRSPACTSSGSARSRRPDSQ